MKVLPFTIPKPDSDALIFQEDRQPSLYALFHRHKELQISYIKEGEGTLIVGESINSYSKGDVLVIGSNLPHVFKSNTSRINLSHMLTVFFTESSFGVDFFKTAEVSALSSFFSKAESGFKIENASKNIIKIFENLPNKPKLDRFILFMKLLKLINNADYSSLSLFSPIHKYSDNEGRRMSAVFEYTISNFKTDISLEVIAQQAAMTKNAFCKYFKKRTRKTYITFLNELRIEEACKLLIHQPELSIAEVAELSGFYNISNFNRRFKIVKNCSPRKFRNGF